MSMPKIEEMPDEKAVKLEDSDKKQKTIQDVIGEAEEKTNKKLQRVTELREQEIRIQKEINEAQQDYIKTREELFGLQLRYVQSINQNLATQLSKYEKPSRTSAPAY